MLWCVHTSTHTWLLLWPGKQNNDLSHHFSIKALDFRKFYQDDFARKRMTDLAVWSERKTDSDYQKGSANSQGKSHWYLEGLGDKKTF